MPCYGPLTGYRGKVVNPRTGRRPLVFDVRKSYDGLRIAVPCGQCVGCRLEKSRQWAMRCMHEKRMFDESCFLTLTYDDEHLPKYNTLDKRDLQLFFKRLRKEYGEYIRYYACGEYGETTGRPHYHVLLFNLDFDDKVQVGRNKRGDPYFESEDLADLWEEGHSMLGDLTFESCAYVARYCVEKVTGVKSEEHYRLVDADGVVIGARVPEFSLMSLKPGLGTFYYWKYGREVRAHDNVVVNGRNVRPPKFYDSRTAVVDGDRLDELKRDRVAKALESFEDNTNRRLLVRERVVKINLERKERGL